MNNNAAVHVEITKNSHAVLELALGQGLRRLARRELGLVGARRHEGRRRAEAERGDRPHVAAHGDCNPSSAVAAWRNLQPNSSSSREADVTKASAEAH